MAGTTATTNLRVVISAVAGNVDQVLTRVTSAFDRFAKLSVLAVGAASTAAAVQVNRFNDAIAEIGTLGTSADDLSRYRTELVEISKTTSESLVNLSAGLYQTISAGVTDAAEATELLVAAQKAAIAGVSDTATAVDAMTVVFNAYSASLPEGADRLGFINAISDKLNRTVDLGRTRFGDLAGSIGLVAGTAANAGVSVDEMAGSLAILTRTMPNTRIATVALNNMLLKLSAPTKEAKKAAAEYGIELGENFIADAGGFANAVQLIIDRTGGSSEAMKAIVQDLRAYRAMTAFATAETGLLDKTIKDIGMSAGVTAEDFASLSDTIGNRLGRIRNIIVASFVGPMEEATPAIKNALTKIERFFRDNGEKIARVIGRIAEALISFVSFLVDNADGVAAALKAMFAARILLGAVSTFNALKTAITGATVAATGLAATLGGVVGAVGAVGMGMDAVDRAATTAIKNAIKDTDDHRDRIEALGEMYSRIADRRKSLIGEITSLEGAAAAEAARLRVDAEKKVIDTLIFERGRLIAELHALDELQAKAESKALEEGGLEAAEEVRERFEMERKATEDKIAVIKNEIAARKALRNELTDFIAKSIADQVELTRKGVEERIKLAEAEAVAAGVAANLASGLILGTIHTTFDAVKKMSDKLKREAKRIRESFVLNPREEGGVARAFGELGAQAAAAFADAFQDELGGQFGGGRGGIQELFTGPRGEFTRGFGESLRGGVQSGLEEGAEDAAPKIGQRIASGVGRFLRGTLEDAANFFGSQLLNAANTVGDFFLDMFVRGPIGEFFSLLDLASQTSPIGEEAGEGFADVLEERLQGFIDQILNLVQNLPTLMARIADFVPEIIDALVDAIPVLVDKALEGTPRLIDAIIEGIPRILDAVSNQIEPIIKALEEQLPRLVDAIISAVVFIIEDLFENDYVTRLVTLIFDVLGEQLPRLVDLLSDAVTQFLQEAPTIILALVDMIVSELVPAIISEIPEIIQALVDGLPDFIMEFVSGLVEILADAIPNIVNMLVGENGGIIGKIPDMVTALIQNLIAKIPELIGVVFVEIVRMLPTLFLNIIKGLPTIIQEFVSLLIADMPRMVLEFVKGFIEGVIGFWRNLFRRRENREDFTFEELGSGGGSGVSKAHMGGFVTPTGIQTFQAGGIVRALNGAFASMADSVPILAQPGEGVVSRTGMNALGRQGLNDLNEGRAPSGGRTINVYNMPGSQQVVDGLRSIDAQVANLIGSGRGRTGGAVRRLRTRPPIRPGQEFTQEQDAT